MECKIYHEAMNERKTVYGNVNCREELYKITAISVAMACVQHQIWMGYKGEYVTLTNVMTQQEAYEITEVIKANWTVED